MSVIRSVEVLHRRFLDRLNPLMDDLERKGLPFRVFESFRTPERQRYLYSKGRFGPLATKRIVTRAKPWQSFHNYGLAADIVLYEDGWTWRSGPEWRELRRLAKANALETLSFEAPHVQYPISLAKLRKGLYPEHGGESWTAMLTQAIEAYPKGAPPPPRRIEMPLDRPYLGELDLAYPGG